MAVDSKYDVFTYPTTNPESGAGHPGHTTPEQDELVAQLRKELEADGFTDRLDTLTLLRFLRARKFDVALAKKMYTDCETWRKEFKVDDLVKDFTFVEKPQVFEYYPQYYHKIDKDGRPVYIEKLGKINLTTIKTITTEERLIQNLVVEYERLANPRLPACSRKADKLLETSCTIMDIGGVGIQSMYSATEFLKKVSAISQNYYPERLGKLYIINAPWTFSTIWNGIKVFLDPVTVSKIRILKGPSEYEAVLKEQIPAENLPKEFGGLCECQGGCQLADAGPWNDPQYMEPAVPAATTTAAPAEVTENQI